MLVGVHRRRQVLRPEARGRRQQHDVDAAVDHLVVGIEPEEGVVDLHARPELRAALQPGRRLLDDGLVDVGDGRQFVVGVGDQRLPGRAAAPAAGAHEADLDGIGDRLAGDDAGKAGRDHTGDRPGLLEEVAAFNLVRFVFGCGRHRCSFRRVLQKGVLSPGPENSRIIPQVPGGCRPAVQPAGPQMRCHPGCISSDAIRMNAGVWLRTAKSSTTMSRTRSSSHEEDKRCGSAGSARHVPRGLEWGVG